MRGVNMMLLGAAFLTFVAAVFWNEWQNSTRSKADDGRIAAIESLLQEKAQVDLDFAKKVRDGLEANGNHLTGLSQEVSAMHETQKMLASKVSTASDLAHKTQTDLALHRSAPASNQPIAVTLVQSKPLIVKKHVPLTPNQRKLREVKKQLREF